MAKVYGVNQQFVRPDSGELEDQRPNGCDGQHEDTCYMGCVTPFCESFISL
jgi:hypothetical protein